MICCFLTCCTNPGIHRDISDLVGKEQVTSPTLHQQYPLDWFKFFTQFQLALKMTFQSPQSKCLLDVHALGKIDGWHYADGVEQYCGIQYADLPKRWTRSELKTSWPSGYHDGFSWGCYSLGLKLHKHG